MRARRLVSTNVTFTLVHVAATITTAITAVHAGKTVQMSAKHQIGARTTRRATVERKAVTTRVVDQIVYNAAEILVDLRRGQIVERLVEKNIVVVGVEKVLIGAVLMLLCEMMLAEVMLTEVLQVAQLMLMQCVAVSLVLLLLLLLLHLRLDFGQELRGYHALIGFLHGRIAHGGHAGAVAAREVTLLVEICVQVGERWFVLADVGAAAAAVIHVMSGDGQRRGHYIFAIVRIRIRVVDAVVAVRR